MAIKSVNLRADALLEKPVDLVDLTQTVDRLLALKTESVTHKADPFLRQGDLVLNFSALTVSHAEQTYQLTDTEFRILWAFVSSEGRRVSREEILTNIWGNATLSSNLFDTHLTNLKKKLPFLKTRLRAVRGLGYIYS
jgi:DNA-binding response OmpR family regulator